MALTLTQLINGLKRKESLSDPIERLLHEGMLKLITNYENGDEMSLAGTPGYPI